MAVINEQINNNANKYINYVKTDGACKQKLVKHMSMSWEQSSIENVFVNSTQALLKFVSPQQKNAGMTKLLCLGKVQSGKTAFFISSIALAFDNGYDIAYVLGGTKNNLLSQNEERISDEFSNNDDILIMHLNDADAHEIRKVISNGCKVILMALKHKGNNSDTNLASLEKLSKELADIPSLIVDDEGDERSPGDKKMKGQASNAIINCVKTIKCGTYLSVTATPQSNLLISTELINLSPDDCILVEPGNGYTGANTFHDTMSNSLVEEISDADDFNQGVPVSFQGALRYFLLGCAVRYLREDSGVHSMLVHPSYRTVVQDVVYNKVKQELGIITETLSDSTSIGHEEEKEKFQKTYREMSTDKEGFPPFEVVFSQMLKNLHRTAIYQINRREGSDDLDNIGNKFYRYKIYVGGNMLERGITLKNLAVTYIYRTAKINPVDNTLQRARWFGYKKGYLDLCKVYMTHDMKEYFVDIANHENFLWNTVRDFLETGRPMQEMERVFRLDNNNLILTRKSVAKTISLGESSQGYSYDRSINYESENDIESNINLIETYLQEKQSLAENYYYGRKGEHKHKYFIDLSFVEFFDKVIRKYKFPKDATKINHYAFESLLAAIDNELISDKFILIKMRDEENQYRSTIVDGRAIKELPESYQVTNGYEGDKGISEFKDKFCIQLHYVYLDKDNPNKIIPFLVVNNPSNNIKIKYVTGEFNV